MNIRIGNQVKWSSAAGLLKGRVQDIRLGLNAAGQTIPWLVVTDIVNQRDGCQHSGTQLAGTDLNFAQLKLTVDL